MNSLIRAIKRNTRERKIIKKRIDDELNLSAENEQDIILLATKRNRLVDEGAIIEGDGSVWAYIEKGTLEKFMNGENVYLQNLPNDFVGSVNIGHMDFNSFPFVVGEWRKSDMHLVDIGDGRKAIDIDVTLDEESVFIKELKRLGYEISMSIEAQYHIDEQASIDLHMPVIDELLIFAYAIVGDGKNVNSNGLELKGEIMPDEIIEQTEEVVQTEEVDEEISAEESAEDIDEVEEAVEEDEEVEVEEVEEDEEDEDEEAFDDVANNLAQMSARVAELEAQNADLMGQVESLKKSNRRLSAKLQKEKDKKDAFFARARGISVKLGENEGTPKEKVTERRYAYGDGIGD